MRLVSTEDAILPIFGVGLTPNIFTLDTSNLGDFVQSLPRGGDWLPLAETFGGERLSILDLTETLSLGEAALVDTVEVDLLGLGRLFSRKGFKKAY